MKRRSFIKHLGLVGGALTLELSLPALAKGGEAAPLSVQFYLSLYPDGRVLFNPTRMEMGQHITTSMAQIVMDGLGADWSYLDIAPPAIMEQINQWTSGSDSLSRNYLLLFKAGARLRAMLMRAAAERWGLKFKEVEGRNHRVWHPDGNQSLFYGDLVQEASTQRSRNIRWSKNEFHHIGQSPVNPLTPKQVSGELRYAGDVQIDGLHYAALVLAPSQQHALKSFAAEAALTMPGVIGVYQLKPQKEPANPAIEGVAVIARRRFQAEKAA